MSERPHPERRQKEQVRPLSEIASAREKLKRSIERKSEEGKDGSSHFVLNDLLLDNRETEKTARKLLSVETQLSKASGWKGGLNFVFGETNPWIGYIAPHSDIVNYQASKPRRELEEARTVVLENVKATEKKKRNILEGYERSLKERAMVSDDGYIDLQMLLGDRKTFPARVVEFFKVNKQIEISAAMIFEEEMGTKDALDWVLGEEDENNGLVKMLAEQRENPPMQ